MVTLASMSGEHAMVFVVGDRQRRKFGYASLIEWSTTSFYIKSQFPPLQLCKVSIHNPDPAHLGKDGFRYDFEHDGPRQKAAKAGGGYILDGAQLPLRFPGRRINAKVLHLVRFAVSSDMFADPIPSAPAPKMKGKATLHALLEPPKPSRSSFVDVFMSDGAPYWPDEALVRANNAGMGPIQNGAGMFLTAADERVSTADNPDPFGSRLHDGVALANCTRGVAVKVDPSGFLWICEKLVPVRGAWQQA